MKTTFKNIQRLTASYILWKIVPQGHNSIIGSLQFSMLPMHDYEHDLIGFSAFHHNSALKFGIYIFSGSLSLLALPVFMCDKKRNSGGPVQLDTLTLCI